MKNLATALCCLAALGLSADAVAKLKKLAS